MRVRRCFAFLDLSGFSAYTDEHGDAAAVVVLAKLRAVLRGATERRGVRLTKWLGDGAMLSGVDPVTVTACCLEVRERLAQAGPLPLRGGIAKGNVIMFEGDDYVGAAVNAAAMLCERAAPSQLLCANLDDADVPRWADALARDPIAVSGVSRPVATSELVLRRNAAGHVVIDPVCGLALDPDTVSGVFCSAACESSWVDPAPVALTPG